MNNSVVFLARVGLYTLIIGALGFAYWVWAMSNSVCKLEKFQKMIEEEIKKGEQ